jgi:hypothetical protein
MPRSVQKSADRMLLQALACGATVENAARKAGMSERTAYRRLSDPVFLEQLEKLRAEMVQRTSGMLTGAGMGAVKVLVELQNDAAVPAGVRRRAARDVLEMGLRFREVAHWEQRLVEIETQLAGGSLPQREGSPAPFELNNSLFAPTPKGGPP